jgi:hypothetical protein
LSAAQFPQFPPSKGKLPLKHFCCHATSWPVSHGSGFQEEPKGQMQGLHIQLAAKPKYICQNSKAKSIEVRKSTGMAPDQSGFRLSTLITCIMSFRSEKMARSPGP